MKKTFLLRIALITAIFTAFSAVLKENFSQLNDPISDRIFYPFVFLIAVTSSFLISVWLDKQINANKLNREREVYRKAVLKYGIICFLSGIIFFIVFISYYQVKTDSWNDFDTSRPDVLQGDFTSNIIRAAKDRNVELPTDGSGHYQIYLELASSLTTIEEVYSRFYTESSIIKVRLILLVLYMFLTFTFCSTIYMILEYLKRFSKFEDSATE